MNDEDNKQALAAPINPEQPETEEINKSVETLF